MYYQANTSASTSAPSSFEYEIPKASEKNNKINEPAESDRDHPVEFKQKSTYYIVKAEGARPDFVEYDINEGFPVISESDCNSLVKE
ncbi:hypothetical protein, partial [Clostridioides difficile]|uniref:hypothetical protein n=1 Tax=Clostridioides difficile TaxID=1496 RepID=UPI002359AF8F